MSDIKLFTSVSEAIQSIFGQNRSVSQKRYATGGDINEARVLTLDDGTTLFMKSNSAASLASFMAEAAGLEEIRSTGAIGVPDVLGAGTDAGISFLLLSYIGSSGRIRHYWETFAAELAAMHGAAIHGAGTHGVAAQGAAKRGTTIFGTGEVRSSKMAKTVEFGFSEDNWIGAGKQINTPHSKWIPFFRDCRLAPQLHAAKGYFSAEDLNRAEYILAHLDRFLEEPERPSLVHGDLWSGNMITGNDGKGWLIDPAVYYGHPEVDIAMTELFGGFPRAFYEAYEDTGMLQPGYGDRRDLYNLYQLLNHLNMFGRGYLPEVRRILKRYAG